MEGKSQNSNHSQKILNKEANLPSFKGENTEVKNYQPKNDIFEEIMKELESTKSPKNNPKENNENFDTTNIKPMPNFQLSENIFPQDSNDVNLITDFRFSKNKNITEKNKDDSQFERMEKLREGLQNQPHFDFGIPLNENSSLSVLQKFKEKKEIKENLENILRKINILKWMKVYTILMNKEIQNINLCLNTLKRMYSFNSGNTSILCEVKNLLIIDCYQLLDVIDADFVAKKIILTKKAKKNSEDKGKIKILYEYYVNIGDLILFKKPLSIPDIVNGEEFLELDIKDIQKIVTF